MPRKTIGVQKVEEKETFDFGPLISPGITMLKFGRSGKPHERLFKLSGDLRYLKWYSGWFTSKLGTKCSIDLEKVTTIMKGQNTYQFQRWTSVYGEATTKSFSLVYFDGSEERTLDLIAPSPDIFKLWYGALDYLIKKIQSHRQRLSPDELFLKTAWDKADKDHSGTLDRNEIIKLVSTLNINMNAPKIAELFKLFDTDNNGVLDFNEFVGFMDFLLKRPDLECLWNMVVEQTDLESDLQINDVECIYKDRSISVEQFVNFWTVTQGERLTIEDAFEMFESSNAPPAGVEQTEVIDPTTYQVTYRKFCNVINNHQLYGLFNAAKKKQYQRMDLPLSYYFMASSHNTYLEGDQLTSFSSVKRYVNDLLLGCRCVELDCWDGEDGFPVIFHGHTMTGKILFKDVIKAISDYAFVTSPYPVVLSIENHCCFEQQMVMAKIMSETFGDKLARPVPHGSELPSLTELQGKILIKGKRLEASKVVEEAEAEDDDDDDDDETAPNDLKKQSSTSSAKPVDAKKEKEKKSSASSKKVHPDLSAITYLGTGKVKNFLPETSSAIPCDMMASYGELKVAKLMKTTDATNAWIMHNKRHLSRIYPKGTRVDSSNYMPVQSWAAGNQLVALNYQTGDLPYHVNFGKFLENGRTGYIIKPDYMINGDPSSGQVILQRKIRLTITIISAQRLPKPRGAQQGEIIDPYVEVHINTPMDQQSRRTRTVNDNGFNPVFNETFTFEIQAPDLSHITFHVNDEDVLSYDFIAFSSLPISCLRTGFRSVQLYDCVGKTDQDFEHSALFVRIRMEDIA